MQRGRAMSVPPFLWDALSIAPKSAGVKRGNGQRRAVQSCPRYAISRCRKVTIWPRVQVVSGEKVESPVPEVTPSWTAHATAWA